MNSRLCRNKRFCENRKLCRNRRLYRDRRLFRNDAEIILYLAVPRELACSCCKSLEAVLSYAKYAAHTLDVWALLDWSHWVVVFTGEEAAPETIPRTIRTLHSDEIGSVHP